MARYVTRLGGSGIAYVETVETGSAATAGQALSDTTPLAVSGVPSPIPLLRSGTYNLAQHVAGGVAPYTFDVDSGTLPSGVSLASNGLLSATAGATVGLSASIVFGVNDSAGAASTAYSDTVSVAAISASGQGITTLPAAASIAQQFMTVDAPEGAPNRLEWSTTLELAQPASGSWLDTAQIVDGATPYATLSIAQDSNGTKTWNIASLVQRWLTTGQNRGIYFDVTGTAFPYIFSGRTSATPPRIDIVTSTGAFVAPCRASAFWYTSSATQQDGRALFQFADQSKAIAHFDLTGITGTVISATLVMNCVNAQRTGVVRVFEANPPLVRVLADGDTPVSGFANGYLKDSGIDAHPDVIWSCNDMSVGNATSDDWDRATIEGDGGYLTDTTMGFTYARGQMLAGTHDALQFDKYLVRGTSNGSPPSSVIQEGYARYYVRFGPDWLSNIDTTKMPGWDLRLGYWVHGGSALAPRGYWQQLSGNGQIPGDGMHRIGPGGRHEYWGHMLRGHGGKAPPIGNPYRDYHWLGGYLYHIDQSDFAGDPIKWNRVAPRNQWFCVEQRVKMNTIDLSLPDADGNGIANFDGIQQVWVDGVPVYSRSNLRFRRHPDIGLSNFHLNFYHGGPSPTDVDMHVDVGGVVIATSYIGPRKLV